MTYTWGGASASPNAFRVRPVSALGGQWDFVAANQRPRRLGPVGGDVRVVGMNLLNYFNTFDGLPDTQDTCRLGTQGALTDCRGADTQAEFDRQWPKTVAAINAMDPDVIGVNEIENDGYGPDSRDRPPRRQAQRGDRLPAPTPTSTPMPRPARSTRSAPTPSRSGRSTSRPW